MNRISSLASSTAAPVVELQINDSAYDTVKLVADNIDTVSTVSTLETSGKLDETIAAAVIASIVVNMTVASGAAGSTATWDEVNGVLTIPTGDTGAEGPQGIQGEIGPQGEQGIQGEQGPQGIQGNTGLTGDTGLTGLTGDTGNGITTVELTDTVGTTKTYTITFTDASTTTFSVVDGTDGIDGQSVDHVSKTSGTGGSATTDVYTVWGDVDESISLGTFDVYNGSHGDMLKSTYDTTESGVVDNSEHVNGFTVDKSVPANALFTDTVYDDTTLSTVVTGHTGLIAGNTNSILQLAKSNTYGAFGTTDIDLSVTSTPKVLPFSIITQSSNTDRFEINADNTITAKVSGTYVFTSTINVEDTGGNGSVVPLTFRITDGTSVWYTEVVEVEISGYDRDTIAVNSLVVLPPEATVPANAYITVSCPLADSGDYTIVGFHSILSTEKTIAELQNLASATIASPDGNLTSTNVQDGLVELQTDIDAINTSKLNADSFTSDAIITLIEADTDFTIDLGGL